MKWLRRDKDCIALVAICALLFQAALLSFSSGLHAATLASGGTVLCTARGAVVANPLPGENHRKAECQCCAASCRSACGASQRGLLPPDLRVPLPVSVAVPANPPRLAAPALRPAEISPAQPRAPPLT